MLGDEIEHSRPVWEGDGSGAAFAEYLMYNGMPQDLAELAGAERATARPREYLDPYPTSR